jgi:hypothetical protein
MALACVAAKRKERAQVRRLSQSPVISASMPRFPSLRIAANGQVDFEQTIPTRIWLLQTRAMRPDCLPVLFVNSGDNRLACLSKLLETF